MICRYVCGIISKKYMICFKVVKKESKMYDNTQRWRYFPRSPELIWFDRDERLEGEQTTSSFPNSDFLDFVKNYSIKKRTSNEVYSWSDIKWAPQGLAAILFHTGDIWRPGQLFDGPLFPSVVFTLPIIFLVNYHLLSQWKCTSFKFKIIYLFIFLKKKL